MSLAQRGELVPVRVSECRCDGTPHPDGDEIYLLPKLTYEGGSAATAALGKVTAVGDIDRLLGLAYLRHQAVGWNVVEDGKAVPFDLEAILADWTVAKPIAEKADELYSETFLGPLVRAAAASSRSGPTAGLTSARKASSTRRRTR